MIATPLTVLLMFIFYFFEVPQLETYFPTAALVAGGLFLFVTPLIRALISSGAQSSVVESTSLAIRAVQRDKILKLYTWIFAGFILFSFAVALFNLTALFLLWFLWLGVAIDAAYMYTTRQQRYLDPTHLIEVFEKEAVKCFKSNDQLGLRQSVDAIAEIGLKGLFQRSVGLSLQVVESLEKLGTELFEQRTSLNEESMNYLLVTLLQRLEMIYSQAVEERLEVIAGRASLSVVKLLEPVTKHNAEHTRINFHFLAKFFELAADQELYGVTDQLSIQLFEMGKQMLRTPELQQKGLGITLMGVITHLELMAQEAFKQDKNRPVPMLTHPFHELKSLVEPMKGFKDREAILQELDRVLAEFEALQAVLQSVPNIPGYTQKEAAEAPVEAQP